MGIVSEHSVQGKTLTYELIDKAVCNLYSSWDGISAELKEFTVSVLDQPDNSILYEKYRESEKQSKDILLEFEQQYPNVANEDNINSILISLDRNSSRKMSLKDKLGGMSHTKCISTDPIESRCL